MSTESTGTAEDQAERDRLLLVSVMGDAKVREKMQPLLDSPLAADWLQVLRTANGSVWPRELLPAKTRALVNLATLAAINRPHELAVRVRGLILGGVTPEEVGEVFMHTGLYCGFPAGVEAFATLVEVVDELRAEGLLPASDAASV